jgi:predicted phosphodiesterase
MLKHLAHKDGRRGIDCSIQVGDMGIFDQKDFDRLPDWRNDHRFIRGNHDNPQLCRAHPNYLIDMGYLKRYDMFCLAGGFSIDHKRRLEGISKWHDEELSWGDLGSAIQMFGDTKPKIVVSHECPTVVKASVLANCSRRGSPPNPKLDSTSRTENALQQMFESHKPEIWIFGHYHHKFDEVHEGVRFVGLGDHRTNFHDQVFEIRGLVW